MRARVALLLPSSLHGIAFRYAGADRRLSPRFLPSLLQLFPLRLKCRSCRVAALTLALDHPPSDKGRSYACRLLCKLPDMFFGKDRILMYAEQILKSLDLRNKPRRRLSFAGFRELGCISRALRLNAQAMEFGIGGNISETSHGFPQLLELRRGNIAHRHGGNHQGRILCRL